MILVEPLAGLPMSVRVRLPNPLSALDDRALLARFTDERDQPAFEQLVKRHGGLVYGVCKRAVRDRHLAEDAFQAVFLVLARNPARAAEATSVGGWLFGVARRVGLAARRHEDRRERLVNEQGANAPRSPNTPQSDFDDLLRVLDEELAAMPDELRAALVACFLQERTQDEAARELGWSLSTLRRRLERGKELLRSRLARRGVTLAAGLFAGAIAAPARAAVPPLATAPSATTTALAAEAFSRGVSAKLLAGIACFALTLGGVAFGLARDSSDESNSLPNTPKAGATPTPAHILAPVPRAAEFPNWATLSGRVVFPKDRELPTPQFVPLDQIKDAEVWKPFMPLRYEDALIDANNRGIANAVVFLRPDSNDRKVNFPADRIHPDLANVEPTSHTISASVGQFTPRILVARAGDRVTFNNQLPVPTNVLYRASGFDGREFNVLLVKGMTHATKPLPATKSPDQFNSSIYTWMNGHVWAFDHPYFAITDANGRFEIPSAPAGKWRLVVWHETAGYLGGVSGRLGTPVTIPKTRTGTVELVPMTFESKDWPE